MTRRRPDLGRVTVNEGLDKLGKRDNSDLSHPYRPRYLVKYLVDNARPITSSLLAISFWAMLALVAGWHTLNISSLNSRLVIVSENVNSQEQMELKMKPIEVAVSGVNSAASQLYGILVPLATAASAYYFAEKSIRQAQQQSLKTESSAIADGNQDGR